MSQAVYRELQEDLLRQRWIEWQPVTNTRAACLIAALPSVTKYSRHSLLTGHLSEGNSTTEKKAFQVHESLRKCGGAQHRPILWHKAELEEPGTAGLSASVRESIAETRNKVLAAVVNAVDKKSENPDWLMSLMISPVYSEMKTRAGRVVISDQQVSSLLSFLAEHGCQQMFAAVGQALDIPTMRITGVLAGIQKLLNVDGYPVLAVDRASKTVKLDLVSLKTQFEL